MTVYLGRLFIFDLRRLPLVWIIELFEHLGNNSKKQNSIAKPETFICSIRFLRDMAR